MAVRTLILLALASTYTFPISAWAESSVPDSAIAGPNIDVRDWGWGLQSLLRAERERNGSAAQRTWTPSSQSQGPDVGLDGWNEDAIAVDPTNPLRLACATLFDIRVSTDGGSTWQTAVVPKTPPTFWIQGDPCVAYDSQGRLFWSYCASEAASYFGTNGLDIFVAQCDPTTGTVMSGYPIDVTAAIGVPGNAGNTNDKEWLAVDAQGGSPFADRLYLVWTKFPPAGAEVTVASWSSDHGLTWSAPLQIGTPGTGSLFVWPAHIAVAPNGDVYVAEHRQPTFVSSAPDGLSGFVNVYRSGDGGVSFPQQSQAFSAGNADISFNVQTAGTPIPGGTFWLQGSAQPWVLPDPLLPGRVYVVANDDPDNNHAFGDAGDIYLATSTDFGATWSAPIRVDSGPGTTLQAMPTASIDPATGIIAVQYYDNRAGTQNAQGHFLLDVYAAVSVDHGTTFLEDFKVNDVAFDPDAGSRCRFGCGQVITDVWAGSGGAAFAVTLSGAFLAYDGVSWSSIPSTPTPKQGVWGSSNTNVYAVGSGGEIRRFDGFNLLAQTSPTIQNLYAIDGRGPNDIFAVGAGGVILHFDGFAWSVQTSGTSQDLHQVWASPGGDVIAIGRNGVVLRYHGSTWSPMVIGNTEHLFGVWGTSDSDFYVTSLQGSLYHWDGVSWSSIPTELGLAMDIWGSSGSDIYLLGWGRLRHFDGGSWASEDVSEDLLFRLHGTGASNVFAVGEQGRIAHFDGVSWVLQPNPAQSAAPTLRIGEYNGIAAQGGPAYLVWCGNTFDGAIPRDQQAYLDRFDTNWQVGVSFYDPRFRSSAVELERPSPNPSYGHASVAYTLPREAQVDLALFDIRGRRVMTVIRGRQPAGRHAVSWNTDALSPGVYWVDLTAGGAHRIRKAVVVE
jgi:hypothetical protein